MRKLLRVNGKWTTVKRRDDWRTYKGVWYRSKKHNSLYMALKDLVRGL